MQGDAPLAMFFIVEERQRSRCIISLSLLVNRLALQ
jgi:hypothetical protein